MISSTARKVHARDENDEHIVFTGYVTSFTLGDDTNGLYEGISFTMENSEGEEYSCLFSSITLSSTCVSGVISTLISSITFGFPLSAYGHEGEDTVDGFNIIYKVSLASP